MKRIRQTGRCACSYSGTRLIIITLKRRSCNINSLSYSLLLYPNIVDCGTYSRCFCSFIITHFLCNRNNVSDVIDVGRWVAGAAATVVEAFMTVEAIPLPEVKIRAKTFSPWALPTIYHATLDRSWHIGSRPAHKSINVHHKELDYRKNKRRICEGETSLFFSLHKAP